MPSRYWNASRQDDWQGIISFKMTTMKKVATISAILPACLKQKTSRH